MITRADLEERVREWGLRHNVVEKDYVLGWLLWGIGADEVLGQTWAFKGGTCLHKCYIETYRFSEDLDFTILPGGPITADDVMPALMRVLARIADATGIDFSQRPPSLKTEKTGRYTEGRVYYVGPLRTPQVASVKLDLTASEQVVRPTVLRRIAHPYPEELPDQGDVRCYSFLEVFAEKIRAMGERGRPRDLYDIINLFRRKSAEVDAVELRAILEDKCTTKGISVPTFATIQAHGAFAELAAEWANMLAHQLPALPPCATFLDELPQLFAWLDGTPAAQELPSIPISAANQADEELVPETGRPWMPAPTVQVWGRGAPLELVRFAAVNRLLVNLAYDGRKRLIEPYCLRRTKAGHLLLHAIKIETGEARSYRVDRIQGVEATSTPFTPRYQIEFSATGSLAAPPYALRNASPRTVPSARPRPPSGLRQPRIPHAPQGRHLVQCPYCQKKFKRDTPDTRLNPHKRPGGGFCSGRYGNLLR